MNCPECNGSTKVIDRRNERRRRECIACKHRFSTIEMIAERGRTLKVNKVPEPIAVPKVVAPKVVNAKPTKTKTDTTTISIIKRNANARRKIEELRESFMDPDYDHLPERW